MRKIFTIAAREYRAMVGTKAFLISIVMMPVLMLGSLLAMELLRSSGEIKERKIAVIDHTGLFVEPLQQAAEARAAAMDQARADRAAGKEVQGPSFGTFSQDRYLIEPLDPATAGDDLRVELSQRIRRQELYAFLEIPSGFDQPQADSEQRIRFYAQDSSLSDARGWLGQQINSWVRRQRLVEAQIDPQVVQQASAPVEVVGMGLVDVGRDGAVAAEEKGSPLKDLFLPMGVMMLMFMVIFMSAQPMLESVLEEKSQRIAEVLLGSANAFQLMAGKLLGTVGGSLTVFLIYLVGMFGFATYKGYLDEIPFELVPWFMLFQVMGVLFYASIFMAIGASVSQLKEAQSMLLPVWMLMMSPMFVWLILVRDPLGSMAVMISLFPPATPTAMMLRMATGQTIPLWQPLLGAGLLGLATVAIVYVAARIFRVGILWQGKTPRLGEILRWAFRG